MRTLHEIAQTARRELILCSLALDGIEVNGRDVLELRRTLGAPVRYYRLQIARRHRAAAKRHIDHLHGALHEHASLGVRNGDLWSGITRAVDSLSLSRWLNTTTLTAADVAPARTTVHILLTELTTLLGQLHELAWPNEA
jgi:hypothetical protein